MKSMPSSATGSSSTTAGAGAAPNTNNAFRSDGFSHIFPGIPASSWSKKSVVLCLSKSLRASLMVISKPITMHSANVNPPYAFCQGVLRKKCKKTLRELFKPSQGF